MNDSDESKEKAEKHLEGKGHAHHQFNPDRADEFREPDRLEALKVDALIDALTIEPTDRILDLGTGSGALLPALSEAVSDGVVVGSDISPKMLEMARDHAREKTLNNTVLLRNEPDGLPLYDGTQDTVLIVSSLHEFSDPRTMLAEVNRVLKPGGELGILEWRNDETPEGPPVDHRLDEETVLDWLKSTGFVESSVREWSAEGYDLYRALSST